MSTPFDLVDILGFLAISLITCGYRTHWDDILPRYVLLYKRFSILKKIPSRSFICK